MDLIKQKEGVIKALEKLGKTNPDVVVLSADLSESCGVDKFAQEFPERYFEVGVAEQNLAGIAAGLALSKKIPFMASYAVFSPGRNWDQIRVSIAYSKANVKILSSHAGISVGADGASHQALEDIALMRSLPNMIVLAPADANEMEQAILAAAKHIGPVYIRYHRMPLPIVTDPKKSFAISKAQILRDGEDLGIFACGSMVNEALKAADELAKEHIKVCIVNCSSIKPLDHVTILEVAKKTNCIVTCEEHQIFGGLGSTIAEFLSVNLPTPMEMIGIKDSFGESGDPLELFKKYKLDAKAIFDKAFTMYKKKIGK